MDDLEQLRREEAAMERKLAELRKRRVSAEQKVTKGRTVHRRPLREIILDVLGDAGCPLNSLLIASVLEPLFGKKVPSSRFGTLSNDERKSFGSKRARPVYLCHLLTYDKGEPIKRFWARSDWSFDERVFGPTSSRVLFLRGAAWTIRLAKTSPDAADPERLCFVAADQARAAGIPVTRGAFPFDDWIAAIDEMLVQFNEKDEQIRRKAAEHLYNGLSEEERLFGARPGLISLPGSSQDWRSAG